MAGAAERLDGLDAEFGQVDAPRPGATGACAITAPVFMSIATRMLLLPTANSRPVVESIACPCGVVAGSVDHVAVKAFDAGSMTTTEFVLTIF